MLSFEDILAIPLPELARQNLQSVKVAVLDTGVDASHEALKGRVVEAYGYTKLSDGSFESLALQKGSNNDPSGHGTGVAAVVAGIAPNSKIADYRVLDADNGGSGALVLRGLEDAVNSDAEIINVSIAFRKDRYWDATVKLLEKAYQSNKIVIASKRNMPLPNDLGLPAELSCCISVDNGNFIHPYSLLYHRGSRIEFSAYGTEVLTAKSGGGYIRMTGTSFATPVVAAFCALLRGIDPQLTLFEVKTFLKHSVAFRSKKTHVLENPLETSPALHLGGQLTAAYQCPECGSKSIVIDAVQQVKCPHCGNVSHRKSRYNPLVFVALLDEVKHSVPVEYCYHGFYHAQNVYRAVCDMLAHYSTLTVSERKSLLCAAVMHDVGYRLPSDGHERESVRKFHDIWPIYGIKEDAFGQIEQLILSTEKDSVRRTLPEKILHDADFFHIGTGRYWEATSLLRKELANVGKVTSDEEWLRGELAFLTTHHFDQKWLERERKSTRAQHIKLIRGKLKNLVRN